MRSEFEKRLGKFSGQGQNEPCGCASKDCLICRVFGPHKRPNHDLGPSRIIVRDAQLIEGGDLEIKAENIIDRKTGTAQHPRKVERVAAGAKFNFSIAIQYWDLDDQVNYNNKTGADALVEFVKDGLRYLEETGIGSGTSKGYGQIKFQDLCLDGTPFTL
ncbi:hypothetical protein D6792_00185 [Candidatus Parcubacteria bacterium]|nr:MAG: hypothetical protein D6792_00185 [Candidatus Parcubacteria bacterium]